MEDKLHKQHCLEASANFQLLSQGWTELKPGLNFATSKGPVLAHSPPSSPSSHNQGWWWKLNINYCKWQQVLMNNENQLEFSRGLWIPDLFLTLSAKNIIIHECLLSMFVTVKNCITVFGAEVPYWMRYCWMCLEKPASMVEISANDLTTHIKLKHFCSPFHFFW